MKTNLFYLNQSNKLILCKILKVLTVFSLELSAFVLWKCFAFGMMVIIIIRLEMLSYLNTTIISSQSHPFCLNDVIAKIMIAQGWCLKYMVFALCSR